MKINYTNQDYNEKETLKKLNVDKIVHFIKLEYSEITDKATRVVGYIILQFTTRENTVLMVKSEKVLNIIVLRLEKKFNIKAKTSLEEFLFC